MSRSDREWARVHRQAMENFRSLPEDEKRIHILASEVDPTYQRLTFHQMNEDPMVGIGIPFVAVYRLFSDLFSIRKAKKEAKLARQDGFDTCVEEAYRFISTTRWPKDENVRLNALELMTLQPERITPFAAWKVSQVEDTYWRSNELIGRFNQLYEQKYPTE